MRHWSSVISHRKKLGQKNQKLTTCYTKDTKPEFQYLTNQALVTLVSLVVKMCVHHVRKLLAPSSPLL
jgi:hypothetical protein